MSEPPLDLDALEALAEAATWRRISERHGIESLNDSHVDCICGWSTEPTPKPGLESLARLFDQHVAEEHALACSAVPALVARVRELEAKQESRVRSGERISDVYSERDDLRARLEAAERERDDAKFDRNNAEKVEGLAIGLERDLQQARKELASERAKVQFLSERVDYFTLSRDPLTR